MDPYDQFVSFVYTPDLAAARLFYETVLELPLVRDQGTCLIFRVSSDGFLGVCQRETAPAVDGIIVTLVADDVDARFRAAVDRGAEVIQPPRHNATYGITHCFLRDPTGYKIEIQRFDERLT